MKKNIIVLFALILAFSYIVPAQAKVRDGWQPWVNFKYAGRQFYILLNEKGIKSHDNLLSFETYAYISGEETKDKPQNKKEYEALPKYAKDFLREMDKVEKDTDFSLRSSTIDTVIDCENRLSRRFKRRYFQPDGSLIVMDYYKKVGALNGKVIPLPEDLLTEHFGWKKLEYGSIDEMIFKKYCKPKYMRKDLKQNIELY